MHGGPAGAPLPASSLCSEAQGGWSPLVAHPMPSGGGPGVCWANAFGFVSRKYHSSPMYFGTLRSPCSSLCFLHATKMWSRVWRGTPHSHRCDSSILNRSPIVAGLIHDIWAVAHEGPYIQLGNCPPPTPRANISYCRVLRVMACDACDGGNSKHM